MDKFNATAWDYAKNRQLHYCQLIIMSHQRQRLVSNPTSPIPTGLGLMLNGFGGSFMNGDFGGSDFDGMVCNSDIFFIIMTVSVLRGWQWPSGEASDSEWRGPGRTLLGYHSVSLGKAHLLL